MTIVAQKYDFVAGVDTHARSHCVSILSQTGHSIDTASFPVTSSGLSRAISWVGRRTEPDMSVLWVIEGAATYGATLVDAVTTAGYDTVEAPRMDRRANHGVGKTDTLDAQKIASVTLTLETSQLRHLRLDSGVRGALRTLITAREDISVERTAKVNALTALLRRVSLGIDARKPLTKTQIVSVTCWRTRVENIHTATCRSEAIRLAKRIVCLDVQLTANAATMTTLIKQSPASILLNMAGIGPVTAGIIYTTWSHPGRVHSEAAWAKIAGVCPIPASSGNTTRHRLNRAEDQRLNNAFHMIVLTKMAHDLETKTYVQKRTEQGLTKKEIQRCLKRHLARRTYRALTASHTQT
ncbi:MAG: IS110 family transposase [Propionibacteriaceae bacterium]|nr:IS110 family transposase [Propionibacteriaceae bacterium]